MITKSKRILLGLLLVGCSLAGYMLWLTLRPVKIVSVHKDENFAHVLVRNFPFTDKGKISWWLENKNILKINYDIPNPAPYGSFTVNFWDFGEGYKEEGKHDRRCFDDIKTNKNCIDKNLLLSIKRIKYGDTLFIVYDGDNYRLEKNGEIIKIHHK
ncbi:DUF943 family protein [Serratia plymuthica]|uniref:DUF943 family protein n=1 Tax=Serratia plymuthica TaxID=82996 RepID=UPI001F53A3C6|nr:DUF943 family protein [Serratia plymuthica]UNK26979.1 DUF943 family protein [Serratia plymuthica]